MASPVAAALAVVVALVALPAPARSDAQQVALDRRVAAGQHWRLETRRGVVHVWIPHGYDAATAQTVIFVHGYNTDVDAMWSGAHLPQQFAHAGINAMFIACEAPDGRLSPIVWPSLDGLLASVTAETGQAMPHRRIAVIGHSGAYRTIAEWLDDRSLQTIVLLDAAYDDLDRFAAWVRGASTHRFINIAGDTQSASEVMHRAMPDTLRVDGVPEGGFGDDVRTARVLYVRTDIGHWPLVTGGVAIRAALGALGAVPLDAGS